MKLIAAFFRGNNRRAKRVQALRYKAEVEGKRPIRWKNFFKKLLQLFFLGIVAAILLWSGLTFHGYKNAPIEKVQVIATYEHIEPKVLQNIISSYLEGKFFDIDTLGLQRDLLSLPWVKEVSIRRKWPNTIIVNVVEQHPVAQWKDEALLDIDGMLFTPPKKTFPSGLALLLGPEEAVQEVAQNYQKIQKALQPLDFKITEMGVDDGGFWRMILNNNIDISLGEENILEKVQNFIRVYPKIVKDHPDKTLATVDLRYKNGAAVRWHENSGKRG